MSRGGRTAGDLRDVLDESIAEERRVAIRTLLGRPWIRERTDPARFVAIVRHTSWLKSWFAEHANWTLVVERDIGLARLQKRPANPEGSRPAQVPGKAEFDRRRYVLLCLVLAALDDGLPQTTIGRLAEQVASLCADDPEVGDFDREKRSERRAFVDVLRWLQDTGILALRDGDTECYARTPEGDALYDVDERLLGQMVTAPIPPTWARDPVRMMHEEYPATAQGRRLQARHAIFRRLLDDPVLYYDDLREEEMGWLEVSRGFVYRECGESAGMPLERRREGLAAVDPDALATDMRFPDAASTAKHAALLLCDALAERCRDGRGDGGRDELLAMVDRLIETHGARCGWSKLYDVESGGVLALARDALRILTGFGLVQGDVDGWHVRPAIARFAAEAPAS